MNTNLFTFIQDRRKRRPYYISKKQFPIIMDLLYFDGHYKWIKIFRGLFFAVSNKNNSKHFCKVCIGHFKNPPSLANLLLNCKQSGFSTTKYTLPPHVNQSQFKNVKFHHPLPLSILADCESIIELDGASNADPFNANIALCNCIQNCFKDRRLHFSLP